MKKTLLFMAMALLSYAGAYAQEEGEEQTPPVHTRLLVATIEDAKTIVADSHYTQGQGDLQAAIAEAEGQVESLADDAAVREAAIALRRAVDHFVYFNDYVDATNRIQNPSFNKDATNATTITNWTNAGFKQNRRSVSYPTTRLNEEGVEMTITDFVEQWSNSSANGGKLAGTGDINQTINGLPAGHYRLTADFIIVSQGTADIEEAEGAQFYANDKAVDLGLTSTLDGTQAAAYSIDIDLAEGEALTVGFRYAELNLNWLGWDNVTLTYVGDPEAYNSVVNAEKVAAAKGALQASITAVQEALANAEALPLGRPDLQAALEAATAELESTELDALQLAKSNLDAALKDFNGYNKYYTNMQNAIAAAEALIAAGELTNGVEDFQEAINDAKSDVALALQYADSPAEAIVPLEEGLADLQKAEASFRIANASYSNPANVILNGGMASLNGWDILLGGSANPALHINTSGNVEGFSKPFMECWVASSSSTIGYYGQENYAQQTVSALPDGQPLPKGYYVLKAAVVATQQGDASVEVSGVTLKLQDQEVAVSTGNGVSKTYMLGFDKQEAGGELTLGLYIDAETTANWIAWDEVELQFVGDKDKYLEEYGIAVLGESLTRLKEAVAEANALMESVDPNGIDIENTDLYSAVDEGQYIIDNPTDKDATKEYIDQLLEEIAAAQAAFYTSGVSPKDGQSFDFSSFIQNGEFDAAAGEEWTVVEAEGEGTQKLPDAADCAYWWFGGSTGLNLIQEFQQTITDMPAGNYLLDVQAGIRVDMTYAVNNYTAENLPNNMTSCQVYANADSADVHPFFYEDEAKGLTLESMLAMTNDYDYRHGNGTLIDYMLKESGLFHSYVPFTLDEEGDITIGFRVELPKLGGQMPFIDYFRLRYFGNQQNVVDLYTGVAAPAISENGLRQTSIYNLAGQRVQKPTKGLYIVNGRKVVVK